MAEDDAPKKRPTLGDYLAHLPAQTQDGERSTSAAFYKAVAAATGREKMQSPNVPAVLLELSDADLDAKMEEAERARDQQENQLRAGRTYSDEAMQPYTSADDLLRALRTIKLHRLTAQLAAWEEVRPSIKQAERNAAAHARRSAEAEERAVGYEKERVRTQAVLAKLLDNPPAAGALDETVAAAFEQVKRAHEADVVALEREHTERLQAKDEKIAALETTLKTTGEQLHKAEVTLDLQKTTASVVAAELKDAREERDKLRVEYRALRKDEREEKGEQRADRKDEREEKGEQRAQDTHEREPWKLGIKWVVGLIGVAITATGGITAAWINATKDKPLPTPSTSAASPSPSAPAPIPSPSVVVPAATSVAPSVVPSASAPPVATVTPGQRCRAECEKKRKADQAKCLPDNSACIWLADANAGDCVKKCPK